MMPTGLEILSLNITTYTLNNPNVIRLEPPPIVTGEEIDYALESLDEVLGRFKGFIGAALSSAMSMAGSLLKKQG
jgi:putrescine aminotransferase